MKRIALIGMIFYVLVMVFYGCSEKTTEPEIKRVATPEFNPPGGIYRTEQPIVIYTKTVGALIRYTTDGTIPDENSSFYEKPIIATLDTTIVIKAIAYRSDLKESEVATATYNMTGTLPKPTFDPPGGTYYSEQQVSISCALEGATIRYTTNREDPSETSTEYTEPLEISTYTTIKAQASKYGWEDSEVATAIYLFGETPLGGGTINNPYQIASFDNLVWMVANPFIWDKHFIQISDIDASETRHWEDGGWIPIGNKTTEFTGNYDGNGFIIDDLYINRPDTDYQGLFGYTYSATIKNLGVMNSDISGRSYVGGLVGINDFSTISNSYSTGRVSGSDHVGGLVGINALSTISYSYSTGSVTGEWDCVGGLVGRNSTESTITNSYSTGSVTGKYWVGGLVGWNNESTISSSYSTGSVTGENSVGGLAGYNRESTINNSYSTGIVTGESRVGGLVGLNYESTINNSYSTGSVNGDSDVGGLVGWNYESTINNSYSTGSVTGESSVGGLVGSKSEDSAITNSYWDVQTSGLYISAGGKGRTTAEMTYPYAENTYEFWNFELIWKADTGYSVNNGYPYLQWQGW